MSPEFVNTIATIVGIIAAVIGAFLFAFWVAMGIWTFNDIRSRTRDWLAILLACLLVLIFPIVGLVLYLLIRPKETLAEVYDRALEEEALLRELEHAQACHHCGSPRVRVFRIDIRRFQNLNVDATHLYQITKWTLRHSPSHTMRHEEESKSSCLSG